MSREFKVLSLLEPVYKKIPKPILFCEDDNYIRSTFLFDGKGEGNHLEKPHP